MDNLDYERQFIKVREAAEAEAKCELWLLDHLTPEDIFDEFPVAEDPEA